MTSFAGGTTLEQMANQYRLMAKNQPPGSMIAGTEGFGPGEPYEFTGYPPGWVDAPPGVGGDFGIPEEQPALNPHDLATRERYTAATKAGALAGDRNADAAAGGGPFTQAYLDWIASEGSPGGTGTPQPPAAGFTGLSADQFDDPNAI